MEAYSSTPEKTDARLPSLKYLSKAYLHTHAHTLTF